MRNLIGAVALASLSLVFWRLAPGAVAALRPAQTAAVAPGSMLVATARARSAAPQAAPLRVLFVGNSHTYLNDMPAMIAQLAAAAKEPRALDIVLEVAGGATLAQHLAGGRVQEHLGHTRFDFVVLQEQQQKPTFTFNPKQINDEFFAPVRTFDVLIRAASARTILVMTAARADGDPPNVPSDTYEAMQERSRETHTRIASEIGATLAPVGVAWRWAHEQRPDVALWNADRYHPSLRGSYLAACVLFSVLYGRSPLDNPYSAGLPAADVAFLQKAADVARFL